MLSEGHLVLVGLMGSGKSVVGAVLASRLDRTLVDIDSVIESESGSSVVQLFAERGEVEFRRLESEAVRAAMLCDRPSVVSTGGGAVLDADSREIMRRHGTVVWLDPPVASIVERIDDDGSRPLLAGSDVARRLTELRAQRAVDYLDAADVRIDLDADVEAVAEAVLAAVGR